MNRMLREHFDIFCKHLETDHLLCRIIASNDRTRTYNLNAETINKIKLTKSENAYFLPQKATGFKDHQIEKLVTIFVDIDDEPIERDYHVQPNVLTTRTDKRAAQAFWFLKEPLTKGQFDFCIKKLIQLYGGDVQASNPARLMRLSGLARGRKAKDVIKNIAPNLSYTIEAINPEKLTLEDVAKLIECSVNDIEAAKKEVVEKQLTADLPENVGFEEVEIIKEDTDDYSIECSEFIDKFNGRKKGTGTTNALFAFACRLHEKKKNLKGLRAYAEKYGVNLDVVDENGELLFDKEKDWAHDEKYAPQFLENKKKLGRSYLFERIEFLYPDTIHEKSKLLNTYFYSKDDRFYEIAIDQFGEYPYKIKSYSKESFNSKYKKAFKYIDEIGRTKYMRASEVYIDNKNADIFPEIDGFCYRPHCGLIYKGYINRWQRPKKSNQLGSHEMFISVVHSLFGSKRTSEGDNIAELFLDYIAFTYCSTEPANFHWVIRTAAKGVGKSTLAEWILAPVFGSTNVASISSEHMEDKFTSFDEKEIVVIEELTGNLFAKLKPIMSSSRASIRKMRKEADVIDRTFVFICFTNEAVPMIIEDGDRRILYVDINAAPPPQEHFIALKKWAKNKNNITAVGEFLKERYSSMGTRRREKMLGRSPDTVEKRSLIYNSKSGRVQNLIDNLHYISFGTDNEFICFNEIPLEYYQKEFSSALACRNAIKRDLQSLGYVALICDNDREAFRVSNIRYIVYIKSERLVEDNLKNVEYFKKIRDMIRQKFVKKIDNSHIADVESVCHNSNDVTSHHESDQKSPKPKEDFTSSSLLQEDVTSHHQPSTNLQEKIKNLKNAWLSEKNKVLEIQTPNLKHQSLPLTPQKKATKQKPKIISRQIIPPNAQDFYKQFFSEENQLSLKDFLIYVRENAPSLNPSGTQRLIELRSQRNSN